MTADLDRWVALDSCVVSDALDKLGLAGSVPNLRPMWDAPRLVGRAATVALRRAGAGERSDVHLCSDTIATSGPEDVIVVANGGRTDSGAWGGLLSAAARARLVRGVVVDGALRDADEARGLGFPAFAVAACTPSARGRSLQLSSGEPVLIQQHLVHPGDIVIADGSGVVFADAERADEVLATAEALAATERLMGARLQRGDHVRDVLGASYEHLLDKER